MRMVTARFLWRNMKYAILAIFVIAAVLTPSSDPWNQTAFALPMIGLYLLSIALAWLVAPRRGEPPQTTTHFRLVFAASGPDPAIRRRRPDRSAQSFTLPHRGTPTTLKGRSAQAS